MGGVLTAIVPQETEPLGIHEHTSKGYCVASGTFYSAIPHKSGALRFHDSRGRMTEDMKRLQVLYTTHHARLPTTFLCVADTPAAC